MAAGRPMHLQPPWSAQDANGCIPVVPFGVCADGGVHEGVCIACWRFEKTPRIWLLAGARAAAQGGTRRNYGCLGAAALLTPRRLAPQDAYGVPSRLKRPAASIYIYYRSTLG